MLTFAASEPPHVVLRLPLPPSANRIWRVGKGGVVHKADAYRRWLQQAGWECVIQQGGDRIPAAYHMRVTLPQTRRDPDNALKALSDLLQRQRVITDDKHLRGMALLVSRERGDSVLVELWAVEG